MAGRIVIGGGLEEMVEREMKIAIVLPDLHVNYQDDLSLSSWLQYVRYKKPDIIVQLGDFYDCYAISRFDKDPKRLGLFQEEIDIGKKLWMAIKKASPHSSLYLVGGNHEERIPKTLIRNAPGMYNLKAVSPEKLFELEELGVKYVPPEKTFYLNKSLVVTHGAVDDGCKLSQHAGYSAKNTMDKWGNVSGIMGHNHRVGCSTKTLADGAMIQWHEIGCMTNLHPEYVKNPNWQQGFATVYYTKHRFHIIPTTLVNHEFIAEGKLYKPEERLVTWKGGTK